MADKIKPMTIAEMTLALDRISRFKFPEKKLKRVYVETICSQLISPKFKKSDLEKFDNKSLAKYFCTIWNYSVEKNFGEINSDFELNKKYIEQEKKCYYLDKDIINLMPSEADFKTLTDNIKRVPNNFCDYKTPTKIVLTEGITEEILLPVFSQIYGYDWTENGVKILGTGGKNRILNFYKVFKDQIKIPIFILLDSDAKTIFDQLISVLRPNDKAYLIENGEIEDIIPANLFKNAINSEFRQQVKISVKDFDNKIKMVENLHNIYKNNGLGEFKKSKMAQLIKATIHKQCTLSEELYSILETIKKL